MNTILRVIGALALLAVTGFCVFGLMATFEYSDLSKRLPWQVGYGLIGLVHSWSCAALAAVALAATTTATEVKQMARPADRLNLEDQDDRFRSHPLDSGF